MPHPSPLIITTKEITTKEVCPQHKHKHQDQTLTSKQKTDFAIWQPAIQFNTNIEFSLYFTPISFNHILSNKIRPHELDHPHPQAANTRKTTEWPIGKFISTHP